MHRCAYNSFEGLQKNLKEKHNYCCRYLEEAFVNNVIIGEMSNFVENVVNSLIAVIFTFCSHFLKKHTSLERNMQSFSYIMFLETFNMGFIMVIIGFDITGVYKLITWDDSTDGIQGFNYDWYNAIGSGLSFTIFVSAFVSNIEDLKNIVMTFMKR